MSEHAQKSLIYFEVLKRFVEKGASKPQGHTQSKTQREEEL